MTREPVLVEHHPEAAVQHGGEREESLASDPLHKGDRGWAAPQDAHHASGEGECSTRNDIDIDRRSALECNQKDLLATDRSWLLHCEPRCLDCGKPTGPCEVLPGRRAITSTSRSDHASAG